MATPVADEARILYLEPDDEIPSVVRRLTEADGERVILVAPGRTKITSSAIGLRLLAREASAGGRSLRLVADAASRALAAEAGIEAFASVAEAQGGEGRPLELSAPARAPIHVVRGEQTPPHVSLSALAASLPSSIRTDDTQAVAIPAPPAAVPRHSRRAPRGQGLAWPAMPRTRSLVAAGIVVLLVAGLVAALLPGATVELVRSGTPVGPVSYQVTLPSAVESGTLESTQSGQASGTYDDSTRAHGTVTFANYSSQRVDVPKGTQVSAGDQVYATDADVTVPRAKQFGEGSTADVTVTAVNPGPGSNVDTGAIDTIDDAQVGSDLCAEFIICTNRLVANRAPVTGGVTKTGKQITQADVDAVIAKIRDDIGRQLDTRLGADASRVFAPPEQPQNPVIAVPKGLVGTKDKASFQLSGTLQFERRYVTEDALSQAGAESLSQDHQALGPGHELVDGSASVQATNLQASGDQVTATLAVSGSAAPQLDPENLKAQILGRSASDAIRALRPYGQAHIDLWPGWVDAIPRLGFRVDIRLGETSASPSSSGIATP